MSDFAIGDMEDGWILKKREGRVELWFNNESGYYGIYLYENVQQPEPQWLLHAVRKTEEEANNIFDTVVDMVR